MCSRRQLSVIQQSSLCVSVECVLWVCYYKRKIGNKNDFFLKKKGKERLEADMSKASYKSKKGESSSQYRQCVPPCPRFITSGDTHSLCVVCLGVKHAESALEGAGCPHCERLPLRTLRSRRALFEEGVFASALHGAGPASAEAERQLHSWGSQLDLAEGMETGGSLSLSSPARSTARSLVSEARSAFFFPSEGGLSASPISLRGGRCGECWLFAHSIPTIRGAIRGSHTCGCQVEHRLACR